MICERDWHEWAYHFERGGYIIWCRRCPYLASFGTGVQLVALIRDRRKEEAS